MSTDRRDPAQRAGGAMSRPALRRMEGLTRGRRTPGDGGAHREARTELAQWLIDGREARGLTREQVAQTTRIQLRTIERIEEARFDELPADVFVRGFIRGYARCVGLPVDEALARYSSCGFAAAPVASAQAQALLDSMASLAPPSSARPAPLARSPRILGEDGAAEGEGVVVAATPMASGSRTDVRAEAPVAAAPVAAAVAPVAAAPVAAAPVARPSETLADACAEVMAASISGPIGSAGSADSSGSIEVPPEGGAPRKRRRKGAVEASGPAVRDSRGRFIRRTGVMSAQMPIVDLAALGLESEAAAVEGGDGVDGIDRSPAGAANAAEAIVAVDSAAGAPSATAEAATVLAAAETDIPLTVEPMIDAPTPTSAAEPEPVLEAAFDRGTAPGAEPPLASASSRFGRTTGSTIAIPPRTSGVHVAPTLVIDDDDPEDAERAREARLAPRKDADKGWRSFLPPALLDQQRGRQGGLTLAVIILLIVATLTLSYLMRRPSSAGEGITSRPAPSLLVG